MLFRNSHSARGLDTALFVLLAIAGAYFVGRMICSESSQFLLIILVISCLFFFLKAPELDITLLVISQTGFLGIWRMQDLPGIEVPGIGTIWISDLMVIMITGLLLLFFSGRRQRKEVIHSPMSKWIMFFLLYIAFQVVQGLFLQGADLHYLLRVLRDPMAWITYFAVIYLINTGDQCRRLIGFIWCAAVISALVSIFIVSFGWSLPGTRITDAQFGDFRAFKMYGGSGSLVMLIGLVSTAYFLSMSRPAYKWLLLASQAIVASHVLIMGFRSVISFYFLSVLCLILWTGKLKENVKAFLIMLTLSVILFNCSANVRNFALRYFSFAKQTAYELSGGWENMYTLSNRWQLLEGKWNIAREEGLLLGAGFKYDATQTSLLGTSGADIALGHLILRLGILGTILLFTVIGVFLKRILFLIKSTPSPALKSIYKGILVFVVLQMPILFFGAAFWGRDSVTVIASSWGMLELLKKFYENGVGDLRG
jgi:hypothetical protein